MCARTGANAGSLFIDLRFEALVKSLCVLPPALSRQSRSNCT